MLLNDDDDGGGGDRTKDDDDDDDDDEVRNVRHEREITEISLEFVGKFYIKETTWKT